MYDVANDSRRNGRRFLWISRATLDTRDLLIMIRWQKQREAFIKMLEGYIQERLEAALPLVDIKVTFRQRFPKQTLGGMAWFGEDMQRLHSRVNYGYNGQGGALDYGVVLLDKEIDLIFLLTFAGQAVRAYKEFLRRKNIWETSTTKTAE